jgi:protein TonB
MDVATPFPRTPPLINVPITPEPPPNPVPMHNPAPRHPTIITRVPEFVPPQSHQEPVATGPATDPTLIADTGSGTPFSPQPPVTTPVHRDPVLLTPESELRPPYPASKLASEQEATLRLRLTIDEHGRVTAVEPVGSADREFLESARRYMIGHWRYVPATQDGKPVSSTLIVTLRFELDG